MTEPMSLSVPRRLKPWQAIVATTAGGIAAQLVGTVAAAVAAVGLAIVYRPSAPAELAALAASLPVLAAATVGVSLSLATTAVMTPLLARVRLGDALGLSGAPATVLIAAALGTAGVGTVGDLCSSLAAWAAPHFTFGVLAKLADIARSHSLWAILPLLAAAPGICEELFFRGLLQRALGRSVWVLVGVALAFSLYHLDPHQMAGTLPMGLYFGWLAARTGSTLVPITAHVTNNVFALSVMRFGWFDFGYGTARPIPWWWWLGSLGLTAVSVLVVLRRTEPGGPRSTPTPEMADDQ